MLYVAAAQPPTAQLGAISCEFYRKGEAIVVVNKLNTLEFNRVTDDGRLELVDSVPVWSGIAAIASVQLPDLETSSVVVLTTCLRLFLLSASPSGRIETMSSISIAEPFGRVSEYQAIEVDPSSRCIVVHAYDGLVRVVPLAGSSGVASASRKTSRTPIRNEPAPAPDPAASDVLNDSFNIRITNLNVTSIAALYTPTDRMPAIALVYTDHLGQKTLTTYDLDLVQKEVREGPIATEPLPDPGSEVCLGRPNDEGVVVVGEESVTVYNVEQPAQETSKGKRKASEVKKTVHCRLPLARITSYAFCDHTRLLLGDVYGKLFVVDLTIASSGAVESLSAVDLGDTASATAIVPLANSLVYLASRFGDSQVVKLPGSSRNSDDDTMKDDPVASDDLHLVTSYSNLAPILDACVVGGEGGSAGYVVTCSGAYKSGSLRVVRRGVGLTELATLELEGIQRLWSLRDSNGRQYLVLGFFNETTVLRVTSGEAESSDEVEFDVSEDELKPFEMTVATLHAATIGDAFVQVSADGVACASSQAGQDVERWVPQGNAKITAAASAGHHILVALQGGQAVLLTIEEGRLVQKGTTSFETDIASLAVSDTASGSFAVVGLWTSQTVHLVALPDLRVCASETLPSTFLIRSVLLPTFSDGVTLLFAGLGDGSLSTMAVDLAQGTIHRASLKTVVLGERPFTLTQVSSDGNGTNVFACGDHPTIVSRSKDRLVYSSVNSEDVTSVASLGANLAVASPTSLRLGRIDAIQQVDVRTVPLDEDEPRRIAHDADTRTFAVLCSRRDVDRSTGSQMTASSLKLFSEEAFTPRGSVAFGPKEEGQCLTRVHVAESSFFAVGTAIVDEGSAGAEPDKGRLLVYRQASSSPDQLELVVEADTNGCPFALVDIGDGFVGVAINSQVCVYEVDPANRSLTLVATWSGAFIALTLALGPRLTLVVGDAFRSITLLRFSTSPKPSLDEVAKDYRSRYMVGAEALAVDPRAAGANGLDEYLGADSDLNLFTVQHDAAAIASGRLQDAGTLAPGGSFHLGEMVSRFRRGTFGQQFGDSSGVAQSRFVYTTSAGSIGIVAELDAAASKLLSDLERNMRHVVPGVGHLSQETYRSFKSERRSTPSTGFVDGTFVQQFLDLSTADQVRVVEGRNEHEKLVASRDDIVRVLEEVARLH
ncbi:hypothetical protein JCM10212_006784 [Sporobolomyces blumeae]